MEKKREVEVHPALDPVRTKKQTAHYLKCSPSTIDRLRRYGKLRSIKVGGRVMFRDSEIIRFLEEEV